MTKKIGLACALIHAPRLLILDEPFEAVDPVSGEGIRSILRNYARSGGTVVMSSHVMELVESLCDELAVVAQGRVLAAGTARRGPRPDRTPAAAVPRAGRASPRPGRRRWRGCAPRPAQAEAAAQQPAPQRLADGRADHRDGLRARRSWSRCWSAWSRCAGHLGRARPPTSPCVAFAVLTAGWLLMSLLVFGVDETVDPARFALLPVRARELHARAAGRRPDRRYRRRHRAGRRSGWSLTWARTPALTAGRRGRRPARRGHLLPALPGRDRGLRLGPGLAPLP